MRSSYLCSGLSPLPKVILHTQTVGSRFRPGLLRGESRTICYECGPYISFISQVPAIDTNRPILELII